MLLHLKMPIHWKWNNWIDTSKIVLWIRNSAVFTPLLLSWKRALPGFGVSRQIFISIFEFYAMRKHHTTSHAQAFNFVKSSSLILNYKCFQAFGLWEFYKSRFYSRGEWIKKWNIFQRSKMENPVPVLFVVCDFHIYTIMQYICSMREFYVQML